MGRKAPSEPWGWVVLSMLRWVHCLGSPSPVEAGIWSALRTPGFLLSSVGQRAHARDPSGASPILRRGFLRQHHPYVQLLELRRVDRARRPEHQVLVALSLGERHYIAHVFGPGDRHHQAVDAGGHSAVRRHAVLERVEEMPELGT